MDSLELNSRSYFLFNNDFGVGLGGKDAEVQTPVASMTKMMTALVVLENKPLDEKVTITSEMLQGLEGYAVVGLIPGQEVTVEDLLYATLLPSAGDAAQALAIATAGSIADFAELMNQRATEAGMQATQFSNPVGMDEENYSTPSDIVILVRTAIQNPKFREMFETFEQELPTVGKTVRKTFAKRGYIKGGKTGYTEGAGRCLASVAEIEGTEYILVTVGAELGRNLTDADQIYNFVKENYEPMRLLHSGEKILQIGVEQSPTKTLEFVANQDVVVALQNGTTAEELSYTYEGEQEITAQTEPGTKLGELKIRQGETELYTQEIYYNEAPEFYNYGYVVLGGVVSGLLILGALVAVLIGKKKRKLAKWRKVLAGVLLALGLVSGGVNYFAFRSWFEEGGETVVMKPEIEVAEVAGEAPVQVEEPSAPSAERPADGKSTLGNCTTGWGNLMLINPNFTVGLDFIAQRKQQMISVSQNYGIPEYHAAGNGDNLMDPEAAAHLGEMVAAYKAENPGHEMGTYSCFRARGTQCGRLCAATGASDHHTGLTCDLIDLQYGTELESADYPNHREWQWLKANSYKYGFIDRFPEAWSGGPMSAPLNVDENGSTGLYETWHYRYVGVPAATEIATGKYNNGQYDSLEHYLKMTGRVRDLKGGVCEK